MRKAIRLGHLLSVQASQLLASGGRVGCQRMVLWHSAYHVRCSTRDDATASLLCTCLEHVQTAAGGEEARRLLEEAVRVVDEQVGAART